MPAARTRGLIFGLTGMLSFSLTLPATRAAVLGLPVSVVAFGRPFCAAILSAILLIATRQRPPARRYWKNFALVVAGVGIGVPLTFAWGMEHLPSAHGAIVLALLPLGTALVGLLRAGERPSGRFWIATAVGSVAVLIFAWTRGTGRLQLGDLILLLSVAASALGYVEGARLARVFPGWQVMCWALVAGAPFHLVPLALALRAHPLTAPPSAWIGFAYIAAVSQWSGMFAWYKGMASAGIARVGQLQLLQPFCTLLFASILLGERVTLGMLVAAAVVVASVAVSRSATVELTQHANELPPLTGVHTDAHTAKPK